MKPKDILLERWEEILARKGDLPAIFSTRGEVLQTFRGIEDRARDMDAKITTVRKKMAAPRPHSVSAAQIGNDQDWPSLFLVSLRRRNVFLPIDESLTKPQADKAFSTASKSGITDWNGRPPTLFKLTSGTTVESRMIRFRTRTVSVICSRP